MVTGIFSFHNGIKSYPLARNLVSISTSRSFFSPGNTCSVHLIYVNFNASKFRYSHIKY